ncbi:MAG: MFS transporter [Hyphomicrobiales bacterium]|nr:MFS transporter [Hyphomicrobiales bacterium]MBV9976489.1 MFS transporter [Hyphomicrobiales bacterium]
MSVTAMTPGSDTQVRPMTQAEKKVIFASSLGTVFEWYDFYLYGTLAAFIGAQFFSPLSATGKTLAALLAFAAGFLVRPLGALVFGPLGDLVGRKYTFLITIVIMGLSTFLVGVLPGYDTIGVLAPITLVGLRMLQGLALGGEYGGAATYVAEHAPHGQRGRYTSWIQTTATLGLALSIAVILVTRQSMGDPAFASVGWRIPFLVSAVLVGVSVWIRLQLQESPAFKKMKEEGTHSTAPLSEAFGRWSNAKIALFALLGATMGEAVVWYCNQFYTLFFLSNTLKVGLFDANVMAGIALVVGAVFFIVFGRLSDRVGRKPIILLGCFLAAVTYFPIFKAITHFANPALEAAIASAPVTVTADPAECSFQFNPVGTATFRTSCDLAKTVLASNSVAYKNEVAPAGSTAKINIGDKELASFNGVGMTADEFAAKNKAFVDEVVKSVRAVGYPASANPNEINRPMVVLLLIVLMVYVGMVYGPIAAQLVELFPTRIRYTGMSLPYHIGNGWFGGFLPFLAAAMVAQSGDIYFGLWYPVVIALICCIAGMIFLPETKDRDIYSYKGE